MSRFWSIKPNQLSLVRNSKIEIPLEALGEIAFQKPNHLTNFPMCYFLCIYSVLFYIFLLNIG